VKTVTLCAALLTLIPATVSTSQAAQADPDKWQFKITPYLWIATIKGNTGSDGGDIDFDTDYRFFTLDNLNSAFFIAASASKGRWTWQTDIVYLNFNDNITIGPIDTGIDLTGDIIELSAGYKPASFEHTEILFGAGFNMSRDSSLFLGYHYLQFDFAEGDVLSDLTAKGLALGVELNF